MSLWWRTYSGAIDHPKLLLLSDKQHRNWFNLMCLASENGGTLPALKIVAVKMRTTQQRAAAAITELVSARLFDDLGNGQFAPHNWSSRQFQSDVSTPRVKRFRAKPRNVSEAPPEYREQKSDSEPNGSAAEVVGEDPKARLFREGKTILVSFGVHEKRCGGVIGQWLKAKNDPDGILGALKYARSNNVAEPVAYVSAIIHGKGKNGSSATMDAFDRLADREAGGDLAPGPEPIDITARSTRIS